MRLNRVLPAVGGVATAAALVALSASPAMAADSLTGSAYALGGSVQVLGDAVQVNVPKTPLVTTPPGGDESVVDVALPDKKGSLLHAQVLQADSSAAKSDAHLTKVTALNGQIKAEVLEASCTASASGLSGTSHIVDLSVLGTNVVIDGDKPVSLKIDGGIVKIIPNEQIKSGNTLTVNALHITVGGGALQDLAKADIIISQAVCSLPASGGPGGGGTPTGSPAPGNGGGTPTASPTPGNGGPGTGGPGAGGPTTSGAAGAPGSGAGNNGGGKLANTGVSGVVPMVVGGVALLAAGGGALYWTRRRRGVTGS